MEPAENIHYLDPIVSGLLVEIGDLKDQNRTQAKQIEGLAQSLSKLHNIVDALTECVQKQHAIVQATLEAGKEVSQAFADTAEKFYPGVNYNHEIDTKDAVARLINAAREAGL